MLTSKQKKYLQALGSELESVVQIGKAGLAPSVIESAEAVVKVRELVKVKVLRNSPEEPKDAITELAEAIGAELVQVIGRSGLIYRRNEDKPKIELP